MELLSDEEVFGSQETLLSDEEVFGTPKPEKPALTPIPEAGPVRPDVANDPAPEPDTDFQRVLDDPQATPFQKQLATHQLRQQPVTSQRDAPPIPEEPKAPDPFEGESFGDLATRRGQQFARGATEVAASVPEAMAISEASFDAAVIDQAPDRIKRAAESAQRLQETLNRPDLPDPDRQTYQARLDQDIATVKNWFEVSQEGVVPAEDRQTFKTGDEIRQAVTDTVGAPDPRDQSLWAAVAEGGGNMTGFVLGSLITGPAAPFTGAGLGSSLNSSALYKEAKASGADEATAIKAARLGAVIGASEIVPIGRAFKMMPIPPSVRDRLETAFTRAIAEVVQSAGEEGAQEALAGIANNLVASGLYDPDRGWSDDITEQALVGAILGGGMGGVSAGIDYAQTPDSTNPPPAEPVTPLDVADLGEPIPAQPENSLDAAINTPEQTVIPETLPEEAMPGFDPDTGEETQGVFNPNTNQWRPLEEGERPPGVPTRGDLEDLLNDPRSADEIRAEREQEAVKAEKAGTIEVPATDVETAAAQVETPTPAQAKSGNYKKGHLKYQGHDIAIETAKGQERTGVDSDGETWRVQMPANYGYIKRTEGADGDHVDVYLGPVETDQVFVVDQIDADTGKFDEHKVMMGFPDEAAALATYDAAFSDGKGPQRRQSVTPMSQQEFKTWLKDGNQKKPVAPTAPDLPVPGEVAQGPESVAPTAAPAPPTSDEINKVRRFVTNRKDPLNTKKIARITGLEEAQVTQALQRLMNDRTVRINSKGGFARMPVRTRPMTLQQAIAAAGGIRDDEGHSLKDMQQFVPGYGPLIRANGNTLDDLGFRMWQWGFLGDPSVVPQPGDQETLDLLDRMARGEDIYSVDDQAEVERMQAEQQEIEQQEQEEIAREDIRDAAKDIGHKLTEEEENAALALVGEGYETDDAVDFVMERTALKDLQDYDTKDDGPDFDIPFPAPATDTGRTDGTGQESPPESGETEVADTGRAEGSPSGRERSGEDQQTEETEQGEQVLVPGVAAVSQRDKLENQMNKPMQGGNAPADGLFSSERDQSDMFGGGADLTRKTAVESKPDQETEPTSKADHPTGYVSDWQGFYERIKEPSDLNRRMEIAREYVLEREAEDGFEHIVVFDASTGALYAAGTTRQRSAIGFSGPVLDAMKKGTPLVATHNHPKKHALSRIDLLAFKDSFESVEAVTNDGNLYVATRGPNYPDNSTLTGIIETAFGRVHKRLQTMLDDKKITIDEAIDQNNLIAGHVLHRLGIINLETSKAAPLLGKPEFAEQINGLVSDMAKERGLETRSDSNAVPDRSADTVRPASGMGSVQEGDSDASGESAGSSTGEETDTAAAGFDPEEHIKISADSIEKLRPQDVQRLFDALPSDRDAWADLRVYILENRPDLMDQVVEALDGIPDPEPLTTPEQDAAAKAETEAKIDKIKSILADGRTVTLASQYGMSSRGPRHTVLNSPDQIRMAGRIAEVRQGNKWVGVFGQNLDQMISSAAPAPSGASDSRDKFAAPRPIKIDSAKAFPHAKTRSQKRVAALKAFRAHIGKTYRNGETQHEIQISRNGVGKTLSHETLPILIAGTRINDLIRVASYQGKSADDKGRADIVAVHSYDADVVVDGEIATVRIVARETKDGKLFYDLAFKKEKGPGAGTEGERQVRSQFHRGANAKPDSQGSRPASNKDIGTKGSKSKGRTGGSRFPDTWARTPLSGDTSTVNSPSNVQSRKKVQARLNEAVRAMLGDKAPPITVVDGIEHKGASMRGVFTGKGRIYVSLDYVGIMGTARHELIHFMKASGILSGENWKILEGKASDWRKKYDIDRMYDGYGLTEQELNEEAIAEAFGDPDLKPKGRLATAMGRIRRFLEALKNLVTGKPFKSAMGVFEDIEGGKVGDGKPTKSKLKFQAGTTSSPSKELIGAAFHAPSEAVWEYMSDENVSLVKRLKKTGKEALQSFRYFAQDKFIDLRSAQQAIEKARGRKVPEAENAYLAEELFHGRAGFKLREFQEKTVEPLIQRIGEMGLSLEDVEAYLYARHAPERNARIAEINPDLEHGSGMSDAEAREIVGRLESPAMREIAGEVDSILKKTMKVRVDGGLLSKQEADQWRSAYKHYVPLRGFEELMDDQSISSRRKGFDIRGKESEQALGRTTKAGDIFANVLTLHEEAIIRAEKNRVGQTLLKLIEKNPNKDFWQVDKPATTRRMNRKTGLVEAAGDPSYQLKDNVLAVKVDGKVHHITLHHKRLAGAFKNLGAESAGFLVRALQRINYWLALVNTSMNPEFVFSNAARDLQTAAVNLQQYGSVKFGVDVLRDVPMAFAGAAEALVMKRDNGEWAKQFNAFSAAGGKTEFFGLDDVAAKKARIDRLIKDMNPSKPRSVGKALLAVERAVQDINGAVENAIRLSTFVNAQKIGISEADAASMAKNLTVNFNRKGLHGSSIGAFYLFFNASIQGSVLMLHALKNKRVQQFVAGIVLFNAVVEVLNGMMSPEDDDGEREIDKLPTYERNYNFHLVNPWADGDDDIYSVKVPLPYGYNTFAVMGKAMGRGIRTAIGIGPKEYSPLEDAAEIAVVAIESFNPIGGESDIVRTIVPTVVKPIFELSTNQAFHGGPIMREQFPFGAPKAEHQRYFKSVSPISKAITEELFEITGGSQLDSFTVDVSPEALDHLFEFATGATGAFLNRTVKFAHDQATGEETEWKDVPFARKLVRGKNTYWRQRRYYDIRTAASIAKKEFETARTDGKGAKYRSEHMPELRMGEIFKASDSMLKRLRKQRDNIENSQLSDDQKKTRLESVEEKIDRIYARSIFRYNRMVEQLGAE